VYRSGTTSAVTWQLEDCRHCGVAGWGWQDNGYGAGVLGPPLFFATTGPQRMRVQVREDGVGIDQIVLSAEKYRTVAPGATKNDVTILVETGRGTGPANIPPVVEMTAPAAGAVYTAPASIPLSADATDADGMVSRVDFLANGARIGTSTTAPWSFTWSGVPAGEYVLTAQATDDRGATTTTGGVSVTVRTPAPAPVPSDVVLYAKDAVSSGGWTVTADATAAGGARLQNRNANAPKLAAALANPAESFEVSFTAEAGKPYRLWLRGKALNDSYNNDSVFVQFDGSVDASAAPIWRLGTTASTIVVLEECGGCGLSGWGWADNGYGSKVLGPVVYFARSGPQRMRIQGREDGLGIDQIMLSSDRFLYVSPGAAKNDGTIF